jgi:hypothetical protein
MKYWLIGVFALMLLTINFLLITRLQHQARHLNDNQVLIEQRAGLEKLRLEKQVMYEQSQVSVSEIKDIELCYLISKLHCSPCIDSVVSLIQHFKIQNKSFHFKIIARYESKQDLLVFKRLHNLENLAIPINDLRYPILESEVPLLFIYDPKQMSARYVFAPNPSEPEILFYYLELINSLVLNPS